MPSERSRTVTDYDDDEKIAFETSRGIESKPTFDAMGIREDLLRGLYSYGFEKPVSYTHLTLPTILLV